VESARLRKVTVNSRKGSFQVEQAWVIRGATREQLLAARQHLKLSGPTGLYGKATFMSVPLPTSQQGEGGEIDVPGVRPKGVPKALGSRARTFLTRDGFRAEMSGGRIGRGGSTVTFGATKVINGVPQVTIREVGTYELKYKPKSMLELPALMFDRMSRLTPPGSLALSTSLKQMGNLHNRAFEVGAAMLGALKVERSQRSPSNL